MADPNPAKTIGELRASGYTSVSVHEEIRRNTLSRIAAGEPIVAGVQGYSETVLPQLEHALIAGHDIVFLGERGQAKSRIIRSLTELLDEWMPIVEGSEINDDPFNPLSRYAKDLIAAEGDNTRISWVHRSDRFGEKLATPDTSIADLIGEVDPIKIAEGRYLSDELTIHYGLVPRTNRGIFAINELPDLAERIQVGLLNVLEERDVQIRGHRIRLPIDIVLVASANPDDYTNRGRIITPLKDRFGAQIRTHYPLDAPTEVTVVEQEATNIAVDGIKVVVPPFMAELIAHISQAARNSPHINQRSGVSVRASVANYETIVAAAIRRAVRLGENEAVPRLSDLDALSASMLGKIEIESLDEGEDTEILQRLAGFAITQVFRQYCPMDHLAEVVAAFADGLEAEVGSMVPSAEYVALVNQIPALAGITAALVGEANPAEVASAVELVLDGLHLARRLNKDGDFASASYRAR